MEEELKSLKRLKGRALAFTIPSIERRRRQKAGGVVKVKMRGHADQKARIC